MKRRLRELVDEGRKLLICVVHLPPLPGSPTYNFDMDNIVNFALESAKNAEEGGADAVIIENFNDKPFLVKPPLETIIAMSIVVRDVVKEVSIPVGVNLLRNACTEATLIASLTNADFIRCNAYCEPVICPEGILMPEAGNVHRVMKSLGRKVEILADLRVKHGVSIYDVDVEDLVKDYAERCIPDFIIVTGSRTGKAPEPEFVNKILNISPIPVLVGSGITLENVKMYLNAHGYIVGTYVKDSRGLVDKNKVSKLRYEIDRLYKC